MFHTASLLVLQIPQIFYSLQDSVKAVLLGSVVEADWYDKGVPGKSLVEEWRLDLPAGKEGGEEGGMAVASDGQYLYVHGPFGLAKVGSGYGNTQKVHVRVLLCKTLSLCCLLLFNCLIFIYI